MEWNGYADMMNDERNGSGAHRTTVSPDWFALLKQAQHDYSNQKSVKSLTIASTDDGVDGLSAGLSFRQSGCGNRVQDHLYISSAILRFCNFIHLPLKNSCYLALKTMQEQCTRSVSRPVPLSKLKRKARILSACG